MFTSNSHRITWFSTHPSVIMRVKWLLLWSRISTLHWMVSSISNLHPISSKRRLVTEAGVIKLMMYICGLCVSNLKFPFRLSSQSTLSLQDWFFPLHTGFMYVSDPANRSRKDDVGWRLESRVSQGVLNDWKPNEETKKKGCLPFSWRIWTQPPSKRGHRSSFTP